MPRKPENSAGASVVLTFNSVANKMLLEDDFDTSRWREVRDDAMKRRLSVAQQHGCRFDETCIVMSIFK